MITYYKNVQLTEIFSICPLIRELQSTICPLSKMLKIVTLLIAINYSLGAVNNKKFPSDFMFGTATAAYQVEGGWNLDGKSENIWDNYTHSDPSRILDGSNGDVATDSYHLYETDVEMLKNLGVTHYRFSIGWTRIIPKGIGDEVNELGVAYYQKLIQLLKQNGIEPVVTLYHWDLPQVLQDHGGFLNESLPDWFANYARVCFEAFGNDVTYWSTFNEPTMICSIGYGYGAFAPGIHSPAQGEYVCAYNLLKAHAAAWHVYDKEFRGEQGGKISINIPTSWSGPATNSSEDIEASERAMQFGMGLWANPLYYGDFPEIVKTRIANRSLLEGFNQSRLPEFTDEEKEYIKDTLDYFSFNTYSSGLVQAIPEPEIALPPSSGNDLGVGNVQSDEPNGAWGIVPLLKWIQSHYNDPDIILTENGLGNSGGLDDDDRIAVVEAYLSGIRDAIDQDVKIFGYTLWSLMDNFEWNQGYTRKFGIYEVDFDSENRTRTPKKSAEWYKNVIATYCLTDECEEA